MTHKQLLLFKISVFLIFIGRAWQHLFWDAPFRSFFWDESLLKPIVENFLGTEWQSYATSPKTDKNIQLGIQFNGYLYLISSIASLILSKKNIKFIKPIIFLGGISLVILAILLTKEKFYHTAQFFEHSIQFSAPFILIYIFSKREPLKNKLIHILKIIIAFTFLAHGLYAFGFYPVPGNFIDMVIQIFGCSEDTAKSFLYIAGILDFVIAALIFIPKIDKYVLYYAVIWGLLTAAARLVANFQWDFPIQSIHQYMYQVLYRLPHGLIPLITIYIIQQTKKVKSNEVVEPEISTTI